MFQVAPRHPAAAVVDRERRPVGHARMLPQARDAVLPLTARLAAMAAPEVHVRPAPLALGRHVVNDTSALVASHGACAILAEACVIIQIRDRCDIAWTRCCCGASDSTVGASALRVCPSG